MASDFFDQRIGKRKKHEFEGADLGYLVIERSICSACSGNGESYENRGTNCDLCEGRGFVEIEHPLSMALAAMNIVATVNSAAIWVSKNINATDRSSTRYAGLKIFAWCPVETDPKIPACAFILKTSHKAAMSDNFDYLRSVSQDVMRDFFLRCATEEDEIIWLYRNLDGNLYKVSFLHSTHGVSVKLVYEKWNGDDFNQSTLGFRVDADLRLMVRAAVSMI